jgi:hypothetical protein
MLSVRRTLTSRVIALPINRLPGTPFAGRAGGLEPHDTLPPAFVGKRAVMSTAWLRLRST